MKMRGGLVLFFSSFFVVVVHESSSDPIKTEAELLPTANLRLHAFYMHPKHTHRMPYLFLRVHYEGSVKGQ